MSTVHPEMVERTFTILKQTEEVTMYEVEVLGMVFYEFHYKAHNRINREYNYKSALTLWYTAQKKTTK